MKTESQDGMDRNRKKRLKIRNKCKKSERRRKGKQHEKIKLSRENAAENCSRWIPIML
jgi:hypothetical protein